MVCLIVTGDAARVAQVAEWPPSSQRYAAAFAVTRRFPVTADDLPAVVAKLARGGESGLYEAVQQMLWSLLTAGRVEWWARRSPKGPREKGHPAELVGLSPRGVNAVQNGTEETLLFDLCVESEALVDAIAFSALESSDRWMHQIWSEALARIRPPEAEMGPAPSGRLKLTGSGIAPPNAPANEPTIEPLKMPSDPRRNAIASALARGDYPGKNIRWGSFINLIMLECGASEKDRGYSKRQIERLVKDEFMHQGESDK
jgi:hypothetical protein